LSIFNININGHISYKAQNITIKKNSKESYSIENITICKTKINM